MMSYEERERIRARASGRIGRWLGLAWASDTRRLLDELAEVYREANGWRDDWYALLRDQNRWREDLAHAENRARDAEERLSHTLQLLDGSRNGLFPGVLRAHSKSHAAAIVVANIRSALNVAPPGADPPSNEGQIKPNFDVGPVPPGADPLRLIETAMTEPDPKVAGAAAAELRRQWLTSPGADPLKDDGTDQTPPGDTDG